MQDSTVTSPQRLRRAAVVARYATGFILLAMFVGTHIPLTGHHGLSNSDKVLHLAAYMTLTISLLVSWEFSTGILRPLHYFFVWLFGTVYGAFDEITQIPVGRTCDGMDWLADILGIVIGLTLFRVFRPLLYRWI
ncbi:MAG: VanZ family protein [Planctomycetales bacterium]|nr:VanZ family protein [Planctomycetales bacterium]